jgi:hypothetical protein
LTPGYLNSNNEFHESSLRIFHIELTKISYSGTIEDLNIENKAILELKILNKNNSNILKKILKLKKITKWSADLNFMVFNKVINLINLFCENGENPKEIDFEKLLKPSFLKKQKVESLILNINQLSFKYCTSYRSPAGKDNIYFTSCLISNFPKEDYVVKILKKCFSKYYKNMSARNYTSDSDNIILSLEKTLREDLAIHVWYKDEVNYFEDKYNENRIKDIIKLHINEFYNIEDRYIKSISK